MNPLCFVLMPFGIKPDRQNRLVNFDKVYAELIKPAILACNLEPIRADEELTGGVIHKAMYERLILCEYAIADLSSANANVFYELGIRHAVKPYTTIPICSFDGPMPFDVLMQRTLPYTVDDKGNIADVGPTQKKLIAFLEDAKDSKTDSPVYQLIENWQVKHTLSHQKTDVFREQAQYNNAIKDELLEARNQGLEAIQKIHDKLKPLSEKEAGIAVDLFLSYRGVKAYDAMLSCYDEMNITLQKTKMIQEQKGFALNRSGKKQQAVKVLTQVLKESGSDPETNGLLGRVYKDLWKEANQEGKKALAQGYLNKAIAEYRAGFDADWRDAFPGINLVTLLAIKGDSEKLRKYLPVVQFAVDQKMESGEPDYWDVATQLELAVLGDNYEKANNYLADALALIPEGEEWMVETTINNLELFRDYAAKKNNVDSLNDLIETFRKT